MAVLNVTELTRIAAEAARLQSPDLHVVGVTLGGEGDYAEVIIEVAGGPRSPSHLSLGVFRDTPELVLQEEIAAKLRRYLDRDAA